MGPKSELQTTINRPPIGALGFLAQEKISHMPSARPVPARAQLVAPVNTRHPAQYPVPGGPRTPNGRSLNIARTSRANKRTTRLGIPVRPVTDVHVRVSLLCVCTRARVRVRIRDVKNDPRGGEKGISPVFPPISGPFEEDRTGSPLEGGTSFRVEKTTCRRTGVFPVPHPRI